MDDALKPLDIEKCVELICPHLKDFYKDYFRKVLSVSNSKVASNVRPFTNYEGTLIGVGFLAGVKACNDDTLNQLKKGYD